MAHSCPVCGNYCCCGGDIDDCEFDGTPEQMNCTCCYELAFESDDDDDHEFDPEAFENQMRCDRVDPKP